MNRARQTAALLIASQLILALGGNALHGLVCPGGHHGPAAVAAGSEGAQSCAHCCGRHHANGPVSNGNQSHGASLDRSALDHAEHDPHECLLCRTLSMGRLLGSPETFAFVALLAESRGVSTLLWDESLSYRSDLARGPPVPPLG